MSEHSPGTGQVEILSELDQKFLKSVGGALNDVAAAGAVTDADTMMAYVKQLVTGQLLIPTAPALASVLGALNTAAATGSVSDAKMAMAYLKQLVTRSLDGTYGLSALQVMLDHLVDMEMHDTYVFPAATNLNCVLTAHADANTWSTWAEVVDSGAASLSTPFASNVGHITSLVIEDTNQASTRYMFQLSYGASKIHVAEVRILSETNQIGVAEVPRIRGVEIPAGETIYYRAMCETAGSKTANAYFRYFVES